MGLRNSQKLIFTSVFQDKHTNITQISMETY